MALPSGPAPQPPPDVPADPDIGQSLTQYLRTFALWSRNMFQERLPAHTALPGILLLASDPPAGTTPNVFMITVNSAGAITATPVALGSGLP